MHWGNIWGLSSYCSQIAFCFDLLLMCTREKWKNKEYELQLLFHKLNTCISSTSY